MSKATKRVIVGTVILLQIASLVAVAVFAVREWMWKTQAIMFAGYNGSDDAITDYRRSHRRILELKMIDEGAEGYSGRSHTQMEKISAQRREGPFEVWHLIVTHDYAVPCAEAYVEAYNRAMRIRLEKPEWFSSDGDRILTPAKPQAPPGTI
jgi:hypothetical protein